MASCVLLTNFSFSGFEFQRLSRFTIFYLKFYYEIELVKSQKVKYILLYLKKVKVGKDKLLTYYLVKMLR